MLFLIIFVIIPLIEIALFITIGEEIGLFTTLALTFLTALIGAALIRWQGLQTLFSARTAMDRGEMPVQELFDGICLAIAGAFLMTPGFFTDTLGFALLVPPLRAALRIRLARHMAAHGTVYGSPRPGQPPPHHAKPDVIDAEYERLDDDTPKQ